MKTCTKCKEEKPFEAFSKEKRSKDGFKHWCKTCTKEYNAGLKKWRDSYNKNYNQNLSDEQRQRNRESSRKYYKNLSPEKLAKKKIRDKKNYLLIDEFAKQARADYTKKYVKENSSKYAAHSSNRRAAELRATVKWSSKEIMEDYFKRAAAWSKLSGENWEVDHIVPLKSKKVCGLHCQQNLTIVEASKNRSKGNRWWPDMSEPEPLK
jgi:hypothetical protein